MTLHGKFVINDAYYSPLSFPGIGTFLTFSGDGTYRKWSICGMKPRIGERGSGSPMAKHALSSSIKIVLLATVMLLVASIIPYDGVVSSIVGFFDYQSAHSFTRFMLGEPDLEPWESLHVYFSMMLNILSAFLSGLWGLVFSMVGEAKSVSFVFPAEERYSDLTLVAVVIFNLLLTVTCYWFIMTRTIIKRSL